MAFTKEQMEIYDIIDKAVACKTGLDDADVLKLYSVDPLSREGYAIKQAAHMMSLEATNGKAEAHGQIGLNASPCGKKCKFCSFASCNKVRTERYELDPEDIKYYVDHYEKEGANLILLLCTATYKFEKLLQMVETARTYMDADMPLLVNSDDMTLEQAKALKAAGANGAYHAVRMREGEDTGIPVEKRMATFANLEAAGLSLSTCVEPIGPEHTPAELVEATRRCINSHANSAGCGRRITVPGTIMALEGRGQLSDVQNALNIAVYRLATGLKPALNCAASTPIAMSSGANLGWAEVGTNPRDTVERTENGGRGNDIAKYKRDFANAGWEFLEGYSKGWILD